MWGLVCLQRPEDNEDETDDNLRTGFENAKRFLGVSNLYETNTQYINGNMYNLIIYVLY